MFNEVRIREIIAKQLGVSEEEVTDDASIVEDLGADSLDFVEMTMTLEEEYTIDIPYDALEDVKTVRNVIDCIVAHLGKKA